VGTFTVLKTKAVPVVPTVPIKFDEFSRIENEMSFLKKWATQVANERQEQTAPSGKLALFPVAKPEVDTFGPGRPSPENARRPVAERCKESLELHGELNHLYNTRAAILEAVAGLPRDEAERQAMIEVKATDTYRAWQSLG
jgi:hypothetical protein